jgi:hypothetical protein
VRGGAGEDRSVLEGGVRPAAGGGAAEAPSQPWVVGGGAGEAEMHRRRE